MAKRTSVTGQLYRGAEYILGVFIVEQRLDDHRRTTLIKRVRYWDGLLAGRVSRHFIRRPGDKNFGMIVIWRPPQGSLATNAAFERIIDHVFELHALSYEWIQDVRCLKLELALLLQQAGADRD